MTDVTGFGLLGHLLEVCRGANVTARLSMQDIPLLDKVEQLATEGFITGASARNWVAYGNDVRLNAGISAAQQALLTDPQTSGGLLVSCDAAAVDTVLTIFREGGFFEAAVIGDIVAGLPAVEVNP